MASQRTVLTTIATLIALCCGAAFGGDFTCPYGKDAACLDYGDKVCSSRAQCVSQDAVCFDSYSCDYKGFVCKSDMENLARQCDEVQSAGKEILEKYNRLVDEYDDARTCVQLASSLAQAKRCMF